jgi:hypothetical protein
VTLHPTAAADHPDQSPPADCPTGRLFCRLLSRSLIHDQLARICRRSLSKTLDARLQTLRRCQSSSEVVKFHLREGAREDSCHSRSRLAQIFLRGGQRGGADLVRTSCTEALERVTRSRWGTFTVPPRIPIMGWLGTGFDTRPRTGQCTISRLNREAQRARSLCTSSGWSLEATTQLDGGARHRRRGRRRLRER